MANGWLSAAPCLDDAVCCLSLSEGLLEPARSYFGSWSSSGQERERDGREREGGREEGEGGGGREKGGKGGEGGSAGLLDYPQIPKDVFFQVVSLLVLGQQGRQGTAGFETFL